MVQVVLREAQELRVQVEQLAPTELVAQVEAQEHLAQLELQELLVLVELLVLEQAERAVLVEVLFCLFLLLNL